MKRGGFLKRRTPLRKKSTSETSKCKDRIQDLLRAIVIKRDNGCVLRNMYGVPVCNGYTKAGELILQADHLITRANSATYADYRLVVCVCKGHHGWKKWHEREYNEFLKTRVLSPDRVALWEACERDSWRPHRTYASDWKKEEAFLRTKLAAL
jgi:hypothetical protein